MNSRLLQQFKVLFLAQSLSAVILAAPSVASANDIKDTNYPIPSGAFFVSPDGKDTNSGQTANSPWPVAKALSSAKDGTTIIFRGGIYRNINAIQIRKKVTLQPYPHEKAWIKGSVVVTGWIADGASWRKDGWNYSFPSNVGSNFIDPNYPMAGYRDMVYINGVALKQVASKASVVPGTFYIDSANKQLYIGDNPADKTVEATAMTRGFIMGTSDNLAWSDPSGTIVRGLGFAHYADNSISIGTHHITLENNSFAWNGVEGVAFQGTSAGKPDVSIDAIVRGNSFSYNGRKGLGGSKAHRMLLEGNTISYNNVERFSTRGDAAGIKLINTDGLLWRNNLVENNFAIGMWADESCINATIVRNTVRNNESYGIMFEISHNAIIAANVAYKNRSGILVSDSSSTRVYNNTLAQNNHNLEISDGTRKNTNSNEVAAGITWVSRDHIVKNNIFSNPSNMGDPVLFQGSNSVTNEPSSLSIRAADYNGYYRTSSSASPRVVRWTLDTGKTKVYTSVATFHSETGYGAHALAKDDVATNPFFVDEANGDFKLKSGSPAIGYGEPLPSNVAQAIGLPSGVKVDLGALQATVY